MERRGAPINTTKKKGRKNEEIILLFYQSYTLAAYGYCIFEILHLLELTNGCESVLVRNAQMRSHSLNVMPSAQRCDVAR